MKSFIYISLAVLLTACFSTKKVSKTSKTNRYKQDSIVYIERTVIDTFRVKADTVKQTLPIYVFKHDTVIQFKNGRASTKLTVFNGVLEVFTRCDSIEKLYLSTHTELINFKKEVLNVQVKEVKKVTRTPWWFYVSIILAFISLAGVAYLKIF